MTESTVVSGIYKTTATINTAGRYVCYATCSGFFDSSEEILVNPENIYTLVKQNRHYNISVEEVERTNVSPTASQTTRNVPLDKTDYIITKIKLNSDSNWGSTTASGLVYAWYRTVNDLAPYKMSGNN